MVGCMTVVGMVVTERDTNCSVLLGWVLGIWPIIGAHKAWEGRLKEGSIKRLFRPMEDGDHLQFQRKSGSRSSNSKAKKFLAFNEEQECHNSMLYEARHIFENRSRFWYSCDDRYPHNHPSQPEHFSGYRVIKRVV